MKEIIVENITYRIGRNATDNTQLIKDSNPEWIWFHLDKFPSSHVVICTNDPNESMIQIAGSLVKEYSKYKFKNIGVNYCKINNLIHEKDAGSVSFLSNKKVKIIHI